MLNLIDDSNFKYQDYENALEYLYSIERETNNIGLEELNLECIRDIKTIEDILHKNTTNSIINDKKEIVNNKKNRQKMKKIKLNNLYNKTKNSYPSPIYEKEGVLYRHYCSENSKKYYKNHSNKLLRRNSNKTIKNFGSIYIKNGKVYRKIFDYYWTIY